MQTELNWLNPYKRRLCIEILIWGWHGINSYYNCCLVCNLVQWTAKCVFVFSFLFHFSSCCVHVCAPGTVLWPCEGSVDATSVLSFLPEVLKRSVSERLHLCSRRSAECAVLLQSQGRLLEQSGWSSHEIGRGKKKKTQNKTNKQTFK